jgi:two-component system, NarL family, nitrate/nitrite response regulator NarL
LNDATVLIVDDHRLFAEIVASALEQQGVRVVGPVGTAAEAVVASAAERPDVVLLDLALPDGNGVDAGRTIIDARPETVVLALSASTDPRAPMEAVRAGFRGFIPKDARLPAVVEAIEGALNGRSVMIRPRNSTPAPRKGGMSATSAETLTIREREVLELLVAGLGSRAIARELRIANNTVRTHVQSVLTKLQVHSRLEAASFALSHDLRLPGGPPGAAPAEAVETIRVLVADENALFRQAVSAVLEAEVDLSVVAEAQSGADAVSEAERMRPDVALLLDRPPRVDGPTTTAEVRDRLPGCRVIVLTDERDEQVLHNAIEAGAAGYVTKDIPMSELTASIRAVHRGDTLVPPDMLGDLFDSFFSQRREQGEALRVLSRLSRREQEVLGLLVAGAGNEEIAAVLVISPQTARTHIQRVIHKLGVHSRLEAAMLATHLGIVDDLPRPTPGPVGPTADV